MSATKKLDGSDKAAILMLTLGEELAAELMSRMSPGEARRVAMALGRLGRVDEATSTAVALEFQAMLAKGPKAGLVGDADGARRLLATAFRNSGDEAAAAQVDALISGPPPLVETLAQLEARDLATFLRNEHPQTIAVTLAHCAAKQAGETLKLLPESIRTELILRVARLEAVDPAVLDEIDTSLRTELERARTARKTAVGGVDTVVALLARLDKETAEKQLDALEERDPELAAAVRERMLRFADLVRVNDAGWRALLAKVPTKTLLLALKNAPDAIHAVVKRNLSSRAATRLMEDLAALPKQRVADVEGAQREVVQVAKALAADGTISLGGDDESYV